MIGKVLHIEDERGPNASDRRSHARHKQGCHDKCNKEDQVIEGPNAKRPPRVEISEIMPRPFRIREYPRDEKSRQYKE